MAYNFRPSRPKAAVGPKRLVKRESVFQVERGPISDQNRDVKQLDEFRKRSFMQRGNNKFQTTSQRSGLTIGEQEIEKRSSKAMDSSSSPGNLKFCSIQTLPSVDSLAAKFTPRCFEYVQNYHHYVLDLNKLEKGEHVPYLSRMDKQNTSCSSQTGRRRTKEGYLSQSWSKSSPANYFSGLPRRAPKSASLSRRGSAWNTTKTNPNLMVNNFPTTHLLRDEEDKCKGIGTNSEDRKEIKNNTLQDLIISAIEDELDESRTKEFADLQADSIYHVPNPSTSDLTVPSETPIATPRSSAVHHSFPNLPNDYSTDVTTNGNLTPVSTPRSSAVHNSFSNLPNDYSTDVTTNGSLKGVSSEVRKPYLAAFTTRIPPLKAPDISLNEERRREKNICMPDYQRYRILCDAFRRMAPQGGRGLRQIDRHRPNFVTSEELDYYINVVNNINAVDANYSYSY